jgi:hypothetical protein
MWRYAPGKRSVDELIDPMEKRLRPRQKIRTKVWKTNYRYFVASSFHRNDVAFIFNINKFG